MFLRSKRSLLVIGMCAFAFIALSQVNVARLFGRREPDQHITFKLGGSSPLINRLRAKEQKQKAETDHEPERDLDAERRWGIGAKDGNAQGPAAAPKKHVNSKIVILKDQPVSYESNWEGYETNITQWKWKGSRKNVTRIRNELKSAKIDIRGRFVTSNATSAKGTTMKMYLTGENVAMDGVFAGYQDKVSPFRDVMYQRCSVVGNSGLLVHSWCGQAIDSADYVFRINVPEMDPYIQDVGYKTSFTTLNPSIFKRKYNYFGTKQLTEKFNQDVSQFQGMLMLPCFSDEAWLPVCGRALRRLTPKEGLKMVFGDPDQFSRIRDYWTAKGLPKYPSTGLYLTTAAIELCNQVDLYGFWPFVESSMPHVTSHPVPYHYFDKLHMVRSHDMPSEFNLLTRLHKEGVLRIHIRACAEPPPADTHAHAGAGQKTGAGELVHGDAVHLPKGPGNTTRHLEPQRIDIKKLWEK